MGRVVAFFVDLYRVVLVFHVNGNQPIILGAAYTTETCEADCHWPAIKARQKLP